MTSQTRKKQASTKIPKKITSKKILVKWLILVLLIMLLPVAHLFGFFSFAHSYLRCEDLPVEINGQHYRTPTDDGYGLHVGSKYVCYGEIPSGVQRDPSTVAGKKIAALKAKEAERFALLSNYNVYKPEGYNISFFRQSDNGDRFDTQFIIKSDRGIAYDVLETKKGSSYDYVEQCSKPPTENWSGTVIGVDDSGRDICRINLSKYITRYTVGIYIDNTAIILQTKSNAEQELNAEVVKIFSAMKKAH